jgi:rubrerythrin
MSKLVDEILQFHMRKLLEEVGTNETGHWGAFSKSYVQMQTAAEEVVNWAATISTDKYVEFQIRHSDTESEDTISSITYMDRITY